MVPGGKSTDTAGSGEFSFLFAHSMLHLLGYDHMEPEEAAVMEKKQSEALNALGITR